MEKIIPPSYAGSHATRAGSARRQVAGWLLACCALVFAMVVVGGVTRLTRSGLSIVEWEPLIGAIPPLNQSDWEQLFQEYRRTPEYLKVNVGMSLDEFKGIFWWEYIHRLLGRLIGLAFLVPLLWFALRRKIGASLAPRLIGIFLLGGLQGFVGWWMVTSGLVDDPHVSHVRLSIHLGLAFLIFAAMFWTALDLLSTEVRERLDRSLAPVAGFATAVCVLIFVMVLSGGLVAGTRAGYAYNTFPLMNGSVIPPEYFMLTPWWDNFLHNMATVQFNHRLIAWALFFLVPVLWWRAQRAGVRGGLRLPLDLMCVMLLVQLGLGIATLLLHVPVALGTAHQAGALVLFALALWSAHALRRRAAMGSMRRI
ncbi:MAG: COX15/CtaA family protein [Burkholderiales bacterium]|nr:COX15/CtaA family protein [Burkholderiales bacterium]